MDKFLEKVIDMLVEKLTPVLIEQLSALIPVAAAAAAKAIADELNLPSLPDLPDLTEKVRTGVSDMLPNGINIPILGDILGGFLGGHK